MADSYIIRNGQVIPYSGGTIHHDTNSWRDATDIEAEQQDLIEKMDATIESLLSENELLKALCREAREVLRQAYDANDIMNIGHQRIKEMGIKLHRAAGMDAEEL